MIQRDLSWNTKTWAGYESLYKGPLSLRGWVVPGANCLEIQERRTANSGCLRARSGNEIGNICPDPEGCGVNSPILHPALDGGPATAFGPVLIWSNFRSQHHPLG